MLFNSFEFIFVFLPIALLGFAITSHLSPRLSSGWLALCSLAFYAYWNVGFLGLLIASIAMNSGFGHAISLAPKTVRKNWWLAIGVTANICLLAYFKYLEPSLAFLHQHALISTEFDLNIILPLGISFFTFTQIGYLVDRRDGLGEELDLIRYAAFVTFFPHLIAGPILHVRDIGPQLTNRETLKISPQMFAIGATLFVMGLAKKVLLADPLAVLVESGFSEPTHLGLVYSWLVALSYAAQLYFDFSGYSDMAVGLAAMFGIRFPANFNSPFRSRSVIEYWQRWHMTLGRYLNLLLYNPVALTITRWRVKRKLGIGVKDRKRIGVFMQLVAVPTMFTMFLAGIWHGAGLQFVIFGILHGAYLIINHAWRIYRPKSPKEERSLLAQKIIIALNIGITFLAVLVGFIFFRADSASTAVDFLQTMMGGHGLRLPGPILALMEKIGPLALVVNWAGPAAPGGLFDLQLGLRLLLSYAIIWGAPNAMEILGKYSPATGVTLDRAPRWLNWKPNVAWAIGIAMLFFLCVVQLRQTTVFLYFQF